MKKKEIQSWRSKSAEELLAVIDELTQECIRIRVELKTGKLKNVRALTQKRHQLAVAKTIFQEKKFVVDKQKGESK